MDEVEMIANEIRMAKKRGDQVQVIEENGVYKLLAGQRQFAGLTKQTIDEAMSKSRNRTILG